MTLPPPRPITDLGIRVPGTMPQPVDPALVKLVAENAAITRGSGLALIETAIAGKPEMKLAAILAVLKQLAFGRSDQNILYLGGVGAGTACRAGCAACCHQKVEATIPEAILVALRLSDEADPRHAAVLAAASSGNTAQAARACPLLVENRCSVYEDRPLVCRGVFSPDAGKCHTALERMMRGTGEPVADAFADVYAAPQFMSRGDQAGMMGICKDLGLQYDVVDLVETVAAILRDPSTIERWVAGETVFAPLPPVEAASAA